MLSLILFAIPVALTSAAVQNVESEQSVRLSSNGEFIAKHYPAKALKAGEQGKVSFRLMVQPDGSLGTCEIRQQRVRIPR